MTHCDVWELILQFVPIVIQKVFRSLLGVFLDQQKRKISEQTNVNDILEGDKEVWGDIKQVVEHVDIWLWDTR